MADKFARRRKLAWRRKGKIVRSRVPLSSPLWALKYTKRGIPESDLYVDLRTPQGPKRSRAAWVVESEMRDYLTTPYQKQKTFDGLLLELKDFRITSVKPRTIRNMLENPLGGEQYGMRPIRVTPRIKTKISRSLARSKVLRRYREDGTIYRIVG